MATDRVHETVSAVYQAESRRVLATLIRLLGDFDVAEEALHDAFRAALEQWPRDGVPANPRAWLVSAGRFKAIDGLRRRARFDSLDETAAADTLGIMDDAAWADPESVEDDRLRLIFTCCHPALTADAQVALTLREVCGLTTEEIAHAFLTPAPTLAQRIVRAKNKIRDAGIPYKVPEPRELPERLDAVLRVIYLVFNEGYAATSGDFVTRHDLSAEAIRLGRLLVDLLPEPEAIGLLALMLLHESRRAARTAPSGDVILLDEQDRSLWDRELIAEGSRLVERALRSPGFGPYGVQAAISAVHAQAPTAAGTDWDEIVGLYDRLLRADPSPVIRLNRAVAIAMRDGAAAGLALIDEILDGGELRDYRLAHAARADMCRRLGRLAEARASYERALALTKQGPERRFLSRRLTEVTEGTEFFTTEERRPGGTNGEDN
ncbi:MAG: RNA polymerase sigma factor [Vicinamibacterales bacterium]